MSNRTRLANFETAYKKRYNRKTKVELIPNVEKNTTKIAIISPGGKEYTLHEYRVDGLTKRVVVEIGNETYEYKNYLEAEIFVADSIGAEEE